MEDKPRYSRVSDILDLAIFMQSKVLGVTINEIAERYNVSRRTAERMRDSLTNIFPQIDEIETSDRQKHWGFINYSLSQLISFSIPFSIGVKLKFISLNNLELSPEYSLFNPSFKIDILLLFILSSLL